MEEKKEIVGREAEKTILNILLKSNRPELLAVFGRRRVGKTFMIRNAYHDHIRFEFSGVKRAPLKKQLKNFHLKLVEKKAKFDEPKDWIEAFHILGLYFNRLTSSKKKVIFIDEFPWLDTHKSGFLSAFDNFWNSYASKRSDLLVVVCGSAASYMVKNIIRSTGGLHNRITQKIKLEPFNLHDTELLLKHNKVTLSRYEIVQIYMAMGGVPHYLERILPGESVAQTLDRLCFTKNGFLQTEFENVFSSLFEHHYNHEAIIRTLATVRKGITRSNILTKSKVKSGGTLSKTLQELEESGFIEKYVPYHGIKDALYRLTDEYSMFYIKYIEKNKRAVGDVWMKIQGKQSYKIWSGFSFETLCMKHIPQIKEGLKIGGINTLHGSWIEKNTENAAQIDLLIDRDDNVINLCEMKFYNTEYSITKNQSVDLAKKLNSFTESTKTKKSVFITFITTYGLSDNEYKRNLVQNELTINDLFLDR